MWTQSKKRDLTKRLKAFRNAKGLEKIFIEEGVKKRFSLQLFTATMDALKSQYVKIIGLADNPDRTNRELIFETALSALERRLK